MPATNLRLLKKLLLQRFYLIIGLPVLQVKGLTRMVLDGEGLQSKVTLNHGHKMPLFGLGVFKALGDNGKGAVKKSGRIFYFGLPFRQRNATCQLAATKDYRGSCVS